jgi:hypothetical protein
MSEVIPIDRECPTCGTMFKCKGCLRDYTPIDACECGNCVPKKQTGTTGVWTPCDLRFRNQIEYEGSQIKRSYLK